MNDDNFFSINRLIEFGMGTAVAQQMVKSMNHALMNSQVPTSMSSIQPPAGQTYFVVLDGKTAGPFSESELSRLIIDGRVVKTTYVWRPGLSNWQVVENVADVLRLVALCPPPFAPQNQG